MPSLTLMQAYAEADFLLRGQQSVCKPVIFKRVREDRQIAYGEVYAPMDVDTHGEFMTRPDIEQLAHKFMLKALSRKIDVNHDNQDGRASAVESFIARDTDPDFTPGAWVLGVKVFDRALWRKIKSGEITGFSMQARVRQIPMVVDMEDLAEDQYRGRVNPGADDGHTHDFWVLIDKRGNAVAGQTSEGPDGHTHIIRENNRTDIASGHVHTFDMRIAIAQAVTQAVDAIS
jgi:hypothetical protein